MKFVKLVSTINELTSICKLHMNIDDKDISIRFGGDLAFPYVQFGFDNNKYIIFDLKRNLLTKQPKLCHNIYNYKEFNAFKEFIYNLAPSITMAEENGNDIECYIYKDTLMSDIGDICINITKRSTDGKYCAAINIYMGTILPVKGDDL